MVGRGSELGPRHGPASHGWNYHLHSVIMFAYNVCTHVKSII